MTMVDELKKMSANLDVAEARISFLEGIIRNMAKAQCNILLLQEPLSPEEVQEVCAIVDMDAHDEKQKELFNPDE